MDDIKKKAINKIDWGNRYVCALIIINSHEENSVTCNNCSVQRVHCSVQRVLHTATVLVTMASRVIFW